MNKHLLDRPCPNIYLPGENPNDYMANSCFSGILYEQKRMVQILEGKLENIFNYVEPHSEQLFVYSLMSYNLLLSACTEFESFCKNILINNGYGGKRDRYTIHDYSTIRQPMNLSNFTVTCPCIKDVTFIPFREWSNEDDKNDSLSWYSAYNKIKHNRSMYFARATLANAINAVAALKILMYAQYGNNWLDLWGYYDGKEGVEELIVNEGILIVHKPCKDSYSYWYHFKTSGEQTEFDQLFQDDGRPCDKP